MSSDPIMYRWSQWLFLTLLEAGLIYRGTGNVDWCDNCQTTLASIQVEAGGTCWRCHSPVRLIELPQWYLRISAYSQENDRRLAELAASGNWDEVALACQQFVLGRVDGVELDLRSARRRAADRLHAPRRRARAGALRADLAAPPGGRRVGGGRRRRASSSRSCARAAGSAARARPRRSRVIDTGRVAAGARRQRAAGAHLARRRRALRRRRPCSASPRRTAPTR